MSRVNSVTPAFAPIPNSPSRHAPESAASISVRYPSFFSAVAFTSFPRRNVRRIPDTSRPPAIAGNSKKTFPEAEVSTGPVKISPSGMLYSPAHGIAFRPLMEKERSVSFPTMRTERLGREVGQDPADPAQDDLGNRFERLPPLGHPLRRDVAQLPGVRRGQ